MRAVATRRARPTLASQAENASRSIGVAEELVESSCRAHKERAMNRESIMPSKQRRAERRWVRWNARPDRLKMKVDEKVKWMGVI